MSDEVGTRREMEGTNSDPMRVVILTTRLPEDIWLINMVAQVCRVEGIVLPIGERPREYGLASVLAKRIRRDGVLAVANQTLLILYRRLMERRRDTRAVKEIFTEKPYEYIENGNVDVLEVDDVNSSEVCDFILSKSPSLVVVSGTALLKRNVLESAKGRIINLHPGFAPQYRGRYGAFWPIFNKEPELVGATIHFVDEGIDTGRILVKQRVAFDPKDTLKAITYKQQKVGVELLIRCLTEFEALAPLAYHETDCPSKNYCTPGLTHYLKARRWLRNNRVRIESELAVPTGQKRGE